MIAIIAKIVIKISNTAIILPSTMIHHSIIVKAKIVDSRKAGMVDGRRKC